MVSWCDRTCASLGPMDHNCLLCIGINRICTQHLFFWTGKILLFFLRIPESSLPNTKKERKTDLIDLYFYISFCEIVVWGVMEEVIFFRLLPTTRWGPLTSIGGFIPSYTHLQPWLSRVCWGYNYLITRGAFSCKYHVFSYTAQQRRGKGRLHMFLDDSALFEDVWKNGL